MLPADRKIYRNTSTNFHNASSSKLVSLQEHAKFMSSSCYVSEGDERICSTHTLEQLCRCTQLMETFLETGPPSFTRQSVAFQIPFTYNISKQNTRRASVVSLQMICSFVQGTTHKQLLRCTKLKTQAMEAQPLGSCKHSTAFWSP